MTNLFFLLCWWVGVFSCEKPVIHSSFATLATIKSCPPPAARFELAGRFVLFDEKGREIVAVDTRTGRVKLRGNPNAAAKRFWKAVELMAEQAGEGVK